MEPVDPKARLAHVDAVRGFALFGVLLVNMYNFGAYSPEWTGLADRISIGIMHSVFETKSWRLFSMLFAFGFALQLMKAETDSGFLWIYFRRLAVLFVFGMVHALFYRGDILMEYAMLGVVLVVFRNVPVRLLVIIAFLLIAIYPVGNMIASLGSVDQIVAEEPVRTLAERRVDHPYLGSVLDVIKTNSAAIPPRIWSGLHHPESALAFFGMFLIGYSVGRSRILHDLHHHRLLVSRSCFWGLIVGVTFAIGEEYLRQAYGYGVFRDSTATIPVQFAGDVLFAFGSTALAVGYASGIILLVDKGLVPVITGWLQSLGRMALTVYLSGALMFGFLFYGYGFGQVLLLGPLAVTGYAVLFFSIQVTFSNLWLRRFRFGPAEWLWRSLTYGSAQPMRLKGA